MIFLILGVILGIIIFFVFNRNNNDEFDRLKQSHSENIIYIKNTMERKLQKYVVYKKPIIENFDILFFEISSDIMKTINNNYKFSNERYLDFMEDCYVNNKSKEYIEVAKYVVSLHLGYVKQ